MKRKYLLAGLIGLVSAAIVLVLLYAGFSFFVNHSMLPERVIETRPFDAETWRTVGDSDIRQTMVDDLLDKHSPVGLTRDEVLKLLGEPTDTTYYSEYDFVYWVGVERGVYAIDSEWLVIKLDDSDKVIEAKLVTD